MHFIHDVFDCHCDSVTAGKLLSEKGHLKISDTAEFRKYLQVFAICPEYEYAYTHAKFYIRKYKRLMRILGFECITDKTMLESRRGAVLALEGADALCGNMAALKHFYDKGVRLLTLTWNINNAAGQSVMSEEGGGLTPFGKKLVRKCEQMGIVVDVSHLSDEGFYDVCAVAQNPFVCSHSNSRAVNREYMRNITDKQFEMLTERGGVTGINMCVDFLGGSGDIDAVLSHIEHFCSLGGEKNVGIGSDFDGIACMPKGCEGAHFIGEIADSLLKKNYSEQTVRGILYGNFLRVFEKCLK